MPKYCYEGLLTVILNHLGGEEKLSKQQQPHQTLSSTSQKNIAVAVPSAIKHMASEGTLSFLPSRTEILCRQLPSASLSLEEGFHHTTSVGTEGKKVPLFSKNWSKTWAVILIKASSCNS